MTLHRRALLASAGLGAALTTLGGITWALLRPPAGTDDLTIEDVLFDPDQPVLGNPQGDVTVVEFFDYQCPFCKRGHSDLMAEVEADGNVRLVMKDWPIFGGASVLASQLVLGAVEEGTYVAAQAALMATPARLSEDDVRSTLMAAGLDPAAMLAAYRQDRERWDGLMDRNSRQAAALGLQGTPAFIIGQTLLPGAPDRDRLRAAIAAARGSA
ncbi:DsbA family protein [Paracoccus benzoatiresistens]|uniref:DsbA family protein n=1 Tax=Paracoccus benzoatiresistens TaxID=2997341 RepID=A0ABT4J972_9RHOB|nr:DsbA family protein [Paracoccus sp. EF6]MCZ0963640.1 DsbA family protein [Paracoccus sp. EF6]